MGKLEHDKWVVRKMVEIYCYRHLHLSAIPPEYRELIDYCCHRLDNCKFGVRKRACRYCPVHCYGAKEREEIRKIMRWSGPRMLLYSPKDVLLHLLGR